MQYRSIIIVYQFVGNDFDTDYHETEDWSEYFDCDLRHALNKFWNEEYDDGSNYSYRNEHKSDFKILDIKYFTRLSESEKYKSNWWDNEPPLKQGS